MNRLEESVRDPALPAEELPEGSRNRSGSQSGNRGLWGAAFLACLPWLIVHADDLRHRPHYDFFPWVWLGAAVLALREVREVRTLRERGSGSGSGVVERGSSVVLVLGLSALCAVLVTANLWYSPWVGYVAFLLMGVCCAYAYGGISGVRRMAGPLALLALILPPPLNWDLDAVSRLQTLTARWSSGILDSWDVIHVLDGNMIELSSRRLEVERACSGIQSLFAVWTCTLFLGLWSRRPLWWLLLLSAAALAWVLAGNTARVLIVAYAAEFWGLGLDHGWRHEALGFVIFTAVLLMVAACDQTLALAWTLVSGRRPRHEDAPTSLLSSDGKTKTVKTAKTAGSAKTAVRRRERLGFGFAPTAWGFTAVFLLLAGVGFRATSLRWEPEAPLHQALAALSRSDLPEELAGFRLVGFETIHRGHGHIQGESSQVWFWKRKPAQTPTLSESASESENVREEDETGRGGSAAPVVVSVDYPFRGRHELTSCFEAQGWIVTRRVVETVSATRNRVAADLVRREGRFGYLLFSCITAEGTSLPPRDGFTAAEPPATDAAVVVGPGAGSAGAGAGSAIAATSGGLRDRTTITDLSRLWTGVGDDRPHAYQFQVFVESDSPLTEQERADVRTLYDQALAFLSERRLHPPGY